MNKMKQGSLIYAPAGAVLFVEDEGKSVQRIVKLNRPANLLVTKVNGKTYEVLYESENWLIEKNKTYEVTQ